MSSILGSKIHALFKKNGLKKKMLLILFICMLSVTDSYAQKANDDGFLYVYTKKNKDAALFQLDELDKITFTNKAVQLWNTTWPTEYTYSNLSVISFVSRDNGIPGDVNGDDVVDVRDVTALISNILGRSIANFDDSKADLNGDNEIDVKDVTALIKLILGS